MPPLLQGTLNHIERDPTDVGFTATSAAYFIEHPTEAGRYILGDSNPDAFLAADPIATALGLYKLDHTTSDRALVLSSSTLVFT